MENSELIHLIRQVLDNKVSKSELALIADKETRLLVQKIYFMGMEKRIAYSSLNDLRINYDKMVNALSCSIRLLQLYDHPMPLADACQCALQVIGREMDFQNGSIFLPDQGRLRLVATYRREDRVAKAVEGSGDEVPTFAFGEGVTGWVAQYREIAFVTDVEKDKRFAPRRDARVMVGSLVSVPLISGDELLGAMNFSHPNTSYFSEGDMRIFHVLGEFVSYFLDHTYYINQLIESHPANLVPNGMADAVEQRVNAMIPRVQRASAHINAGIDPELGDDIQSLLAEIVELRQMLKRDKG